MNGLFIFLHIAASVLLITVILMQSGRGGGLTESFSSAESMFGGKTNEFMVRATTILACVFLVTSLSLAFISSKREKSIMPAQTAMPAPKSSETLPGMPSIPPIPTAE